MTVKIHTLGVCPPFSDTPKRGDKFFFGRMMRDQRESSIHCRSEHVKQAKWLRWRRLHLICRGLSIHIQKYREKKWDFYQPGLGGFGAEPVRFNRVPEKVPVSQVRFNRICGHLTHGNPAEVFPALGFAARLRRICKNNA